MYVRTCIHTHMGLCICVIMSVPMYVHQCVFTSPGAHIYIYMHVCTGVIIVDCVARVLFLNCREAYSCSCTLVEGTA